MIAWRRVLAATAAVFTAACSGASSPGASQSVTAPSNCVFAVPADQTFKSVLAAGGEATVPVSTAVGCAWTASSGASFISVSGGAAMTGSGVARFTIAANGGDARLGSVTVAGTSITVSQTGSTCVTLVSPPTRSLTPDSTFENAMVTAPAGCGWEVRSLSDFLSVTASAKGVGSGTFGFAVSENVSDRSRQGLLSVGGAAMVVSQAAALSMVASVPVSSPVTFYSSPVAQTITPPAGGRWDHLRFNWYDATGSPSASGTLFVLDRLYTSRLQDLTASTAGALAQTTTVLRNEYLLPEDLTLSCGTQYFFCTFGLPGAISASRDGSVYDGGEMFSPVSVLFTLARPNGSNSGTIDAFFRLRGIVK